MRKNMLNKLKKRFNFYVTTSSIVLIGGIVLYVCWFVIISESNGFMGKPSTFWKHLPFLFTFWPLFFLYPKIIRVNTRIREIEFNTKTHPKGITNSELQNLETEYNRLEIISDIVSVMGWGTLIVIYICSRKEPVSTFIYVLSLLLRLSVFIAPIIFIEKRIKQINTRIRQIEFKAMHKEIDE